MGVFIPSIILQILPLPKLLIEINPNTLSRIEKESQRVPYAPSKTAPSSFKKLYINAANLRDQFQEEGYNIN